MTIEDRVRYLLRAAGRAEGEGELRVARALRRMAYDVLPVDVSSPLWSPDRGHCPRD